eukprot:XP_028343283.1 ADP-ribosylation factor-like protein 2 [Physeter catodon]
MVLLKVLRKTKQKERELRLLILYKLNIWDVGGQRTIRSFWRNYFEETDGVVWVVDASDSARLSVCREELHKLMKEERLAGASLLVLANKQDIRSAASARDICEALDLRKMESSRHWHILPCSARDGSGLLEGFTWLVNDISSRIFVGT